MKVFLSIFLSASLLWAMEKNSSVNDQKTKAKPTLVLDLDDVLLHRGKVYPERLSPLLVKDQAGVSYICPAFTAEFLTFARDKFTVTFFSAGGTQRNLSVLIDLWNQVFRRDLPKDLKLWNRPDLTYAQNNSEHKGDFWRGPGKKDIAKCGDIRSTLLVDDNSSWILKGQEKNWIMAPSLNFASLFFYFEYYQADQDFAYFCEEAIKDVDEFPYLLSYYKLLYVTGILAHALENKRELTEGLFSLQFENDEPPFASNPESIELYKKGYQVLQDYAARKTMPSYFAAIEKHFK